MNSKETSLNNSLALVESLAEECRSKQAALKKLEAEAVDLKTEITEIKTTILNLMQKHNVSSLKYASVGNVIMTTKSHYEIMDKEKFATNMLRALVDAVQEGRNIVDGFIAQFRPAKDAFEVYLTTHNIEDTGVRLVNKSDITIRG